MAATLTRFLETRKITTWQDLLYPGAATDFFCRRKFAPFDPEARSYHAANALWLAELSRLVYRHDEEEDHPPPQPTQTGFLEQAGCSRRRFFISRATDTQALLLEFKQDKPFAVLVFRGTEQNIKDFVTDITLGKLHLRDEQVDVHAGFRKALDSVWNEIGSALQALECPLYFTGHSLGAALATLAAARHAPTALYTFGSPRVGDADFVASLGNIAGIIHRVVDDRDVVTLLPPKELGFEHIGTLHKLTAPAGSLVSRLASLFGPPKPLADHAPLNYVDRI